MESRIDLFIDAVWDCRIWEQRIDGVYLLSILAMARKNNLESGMQDVREILPDGSSATLVRTLVLGLIFLLVLLLASNFLLSRFSTNVGYTWIRMKWELLLDLDRPVDILVLGDSSMNQGLDTDYIAATEQVSALNLATNGALISVNDVWMLERYLKELRFTYLCRGRSHL